jgi:hypothetical protein
MKTLTVKQKLTEQYMNEPVIRVLHLPRNYEEICERAQAIYRARGGMMGMTLNDWLKAEQELKRELGLQTDETDNHETNYENNEF